MRLNKFLDACTCGRADKAALNALKKQLESRDSSIESLEEEIRRKDLEKDNLIVMQRELQSQIEEIRTLLNAHAGIAGMTDDKAAAIMQRRTRGINSRKRVATIKNLKAQEEKSVVALQSRARGLRGRRSVAARKSSKSLPGQDRLDREAEQTPHVVKLQARARGKSQRRMVAEKASVGVLPGQIRVNGMPAGAFGYSEGGSSYFDENESVDSDYDYEDGAFEGLGLELLAGDRAPLNTPLRTRLPSHRVSLSRLCYRLCSRLFSLRQAQARQGVRAGGAAGRGGGARVGGALLCAL